MRESDAASSLRLRALTRCLIALGAVLAYSLGAFADTPAPAIQEVAIDLNTHTISGVLSFGTPFAFAGTVPANVTSISTSYIKCPQSNCSSVLESASGCTPPSGSEWKQVPKQNSLGAPGSNGTRPFHINIGMQPKQPKDQKHPTTEPDALDPNAYYLFRFDIETTPDAPTTTKFQQAVRETIARTTLAVASGDITDDQYIAMQKEIIAAMTKAAGSCARIQAPNLFIESKGLLRHAIENNLKVVAAVKQYPNDESDLELHLRAMQASPLPRLFAALHFHPTPDATASDQAANGDILHYVGLAPFELTAVVNGADPANPLPKAPLATDTSDTEFTARATAYTATARIVNRLQTWIAALLMRNGGIDKLVSANLFTASDKAALKLLFAPNGDADRAEADLIGIAGTMTDAATRVTNREKLLDSATQQVSFTAISTTVINGSTLGTFETFAGYYISGDAGFVVIPEIHKVLPYLGTNFYTMPVNRNVSLTQDGRWRRRIAFTIGLTLSTVEDAQHARRSDLFGAQSLVLGGGVRITDVFRISAGGVVFNGKNPNPLIKKDRLAATPYIALSFDVNLARTFAGIGKLFP